MSNYAPAILTLAFSIGPLVVGIWWWLPRATGYEWFSHRVAHEMWALVAATAILFSVQLLVFWVLSGLVVASYREVTAGINRG